MIYVLRSWRYTKDISSIRNSFDVPLVYHVSDQGYRACINASAGESFQVGDKRNVL